MNIKKLETKIIKHSSGCFLWSGSKTKDGYSRHGGGKAHRLMYIYYVGPIPKGLELDHLCRNRGCVNPKHLEAVTHRENVRRGALGKATAKRQTSKTKCKNGHPYSKGNTYTAPKAYTQNGVPTKTPARHCIICKYKANKKWREKVRHANNTK